MGLDDFLGDTTEPQEVNKHDYSQDSDDGKGETSNSNFYRFDRDEFESVLDDTGLFFTVQNYDWTKELVYEADSNEGRFSVRVYSSIDERTNKARDKGSDAIRVVLIDNKNRRPVMKQRRVNRIKTYDKNLKKRINNIVDSKDNLKFCDTCGSLMVIRKNKAKDKKFWGCTNYPDCNYTEEL